MFSQTNSWPDCTHSRQLFPGPAGVTALVLGAGDILWYPHSRRKTNSWSRPWEASSWIYSGWSEAQTLWFFFRSSAGEASDCHPEDDWSPKMGGNTFL